MDYLLIFVISIFKIIFYLIFIYFYIYLSLIFLISYHFLIDFLVQNLYKYSLYSSFLFLYSFIFLLLSITFIFIILYLFKYFYTFTFIILIISQLSTWITSLMIKSLEEIYQEILVQQLFGMITFSILWITYLW